MKLATFTQSGRTRIGVVQEGGMLDLSAAAPALPQEMRSFLEAGAPALTAARAASGSLIPMKDVRLEAPVLRPSKFLAIGLNYADHIAETGRETPQNQLWFNKQTTCVNAPYDPVHLPRVSSALDYEGELGFVIGRKCRHVPRDRAHEVIAGYFIVNDVSVRDWQMHSQTMTMGKSFDTHGPFGPWIVTPDEVGDPHNLSIRTLLNGAVMQDSNTRHLVFNCYDQIAYLTQAFTLLPGDVIATGTPGGVGVAKTPPLFMKAGDWVRIEIEKIGAIEQEIIPEPADTVCLI
jgi:2-keto-4-pentenoate hydratase/2-oxohepta-3-ene-1,7-dioic acid hydratase in catechol pathway